MQANSGLSKKVVLLESAHSGCSDKEREFMDRLKDMEKERDDWRVWVLEGKKTKLVAELAQAEMDRHKLVREFVSAVVKKLHMSVEYRKSLAVPIGLCFTADALIKISPYVPPPTVNDGTGPSTKNNNDGTATKGPLKIQMTETTTGTPARTAV
ncbi:hypothetical protein Tco_0615211 [Tanacetum coccineum]